ncbi:uncharacterized protein LOC125830099 [Solanum verrucosum]|uniref:uncharacterized protein LOC125830099 n=1 Tax=Solanum verrucosum TaxID=315347 RepID=UPI0020D129DE|nr:uncharacterized protein LOC125830099 [Solanum verrucosum]
MLSHVETYQVGQRGNRQEVADTSRIRELLRMNPPSFTGSSVTEDLENFIEELKRLFDGMHIADAERVQQVAYQIKGVARIWFDQWKNNRAEDAAISSKKGKVAMLIGDMDLARLIIYVQQVEEDKMNDREEFKNKRANTSGDEFSAEFRAKPAHSQGSMAQRGSKPPACAKCGRNHPGICREGSTGYFKCGQNSHFMRDCPENM